MMENLLDKFTSHFKKILIQAQTIAWQEESGAIEPVHLFEALLQQQGSLGFEIMQRQNITYSNTTFRSPERLNDRRATEVLTDHWHLPQPSEKSQRIIELAVKTSFEYRHKYVGSEHLLSGIIKTPDAKIRDIFSAHAVNMQNLNQHLDTVLRSTSRFNQAPASDTPDGKQADTDIFEQQTQPPSMLELFATDLTTDAVQKDIDPVIGRKNEINRLIQILSRRTKNNPVLLGDPGVGKTAIVEGLAKKILHGEVPDILSEKRILSLDLSAIVAGTMYRGEFENRLKQIIDEVKQDENIILFIDEIHNIIGTGSSAGSLDAANILKPALARGQLRCIGATTHEEYKKFIESDKALERRFQVIMVDEASEQETRDILKGIKENYERYHAVQITEAALDASVSLSKRYLTDKKFPDKAIDLIDEAASHIKVARKYNAQTKRIKELERSLKSIQEAKRNFILNENYTQALNIKDQEDIVLQELNNLKALKEKSAPELLGSIDASDIAAVVSQTTGIPLHEIEASEKRQLAHLEHHLQKHLFGQNEAIAKVAETIRRSRSGLSDPRKPLGSFMFLGPSGVGKTEMARLLSRILFNREDALIRVDMSEFAERFNVSKLIGAPAGYVGYKDGNLLTDAVRKKPYSVVLFDEIEKAHPDVFNILLPVLEDGYLTDAAGKQINFRNTIIIMTSNIGLKEFTNQAHVGFTIHPGDTTLNRHEMQEYVMKSLKEHFRPEFLNRLDTIITFNPLNESVAKKIIQRELKEVEDRMAIRGQKLAIDANVTRYLVSAFKPQEGARSLKRAVQRLVVDPLALKLLNGEIAPDKKTINLRLAGETIVFE